MNVGDTIEEKYEIVRLLGQGGMGTVYEARHLRLGKRVALKFLKGELANNPEAASRFLREARAAASIGSEHIVDVMDVSQTPEGSPYLVMEFLEGNDLSKLIATDGPFDPVRAARLVVQLCHALGSAHAQGIIHRDIKPENMMIELRYDGTERLKVLDFGLVKFRKAVEGQTANLTATGATMGTPYYMAPEQAMGEKSLDHRVDIYSAGVVLFQMLTKALPFEGETYAEILVKAATKEPLRPRAVRPDLPEALENIVMWAIARDPSQRCGTAAELAQALTPFAAATQESPAAVGSAPTQLPGSIPGVVSSIPGFGSSPSGQGTWQSGAGAPLPGQVSPQTFALGGGTAPSDPSQSVPQASLMTPSPYSQSGSQVSVPPQSIPGQMIPQTSTPPTPFQTVPPVTMTPTSSSRTLRYVGLAVIVLLLAGITSGAVWFFLSHGEGGDEVASQDTPSPSTQGGPDTAGAVQPELLGTPPSLTQPSPVPITDAGAAPPQEEPQPAEEPEEQHDDSSSHRRRESEDPPDPQVEPSAHEEPEPPPPEPHQPQQPQQLPFPAAPEQRQPASLPFPSVPPQPQPQPQPQQVLQPQPAPAPPPPRPAGDAFAEGRARAAAHDWNGCLNSLNNAASSPQVNALRIRCYHGAGNTAQACYYASRCTGNRYCQRYWRRHCH